MWKQLRYLRPHAWLVVAALSLTFVNALADLYLPTLMARMVDSGVAQGDVGAILRVGGRMLLVVMGSSCCYVGATYLSSRISMAFGRDLRHRIFSKVAGFSLGEYDRFGAATLITRTSNDVTQVQ